MICSFECTFCRSCVERVLLNVCPNCGGGFCERPVRPNRYLGKRPPVSEVTYSPVDPAAHALFAEPIRNVPAWER